MAYKATMLRKLIPLMSTFSLISACGAHQGAASGASETKLQPAHTSVDNALGNAGAPHTLPRQFAALIERARAASKQPASDAKEADLPASLRDIDWNAYRTIAFRPERSLWRNEPGHFEAQFFHLGFIYRYPVAMSVIEGDETRPLPFSTELFTYGAVPAPAPNPGLGYAGMRLHTNLNSDDYRDEIIVFQGSSYFRSLGRGDYLGLSGRALAIDTGESTPEEFPRFSEMYLVRPGKDERSMWVLATLESKRATGAVAFHVEPGDVTVIDITVHVFLREPVKVLGIAPFSSMHLYGESAPHRFDSVRPEVHDSDGLAMWTAEGERVLRPLRNPERTTVREYRLDSPKGFGLLQRDRKFESYQDLVERYQDRPSAWVEPMGDWGKGKVRLLEFATNLESDDNVALSWVPDQVPADGLSVRYRLHFGSNVEGKQQFGKALDTRITPIGADKARFTIDFQVPNANQLKTPVQLELTTPDAQVLSTSVVQNPFLPGFRASFEVVRKDPSRETDLRAYLRTGNDVLTETWSYPWQPTH